MSNGAIDELRRRYRPANIRLLFIGESPPASGEFFYDDSSSVMLRAHTMKAFSNVLGLSFSSDRQFLNCFKSTGCYLDDITDVPVDKVSAEDRRSKLDIALPRFVERLNDTAPDIIVIMLKRLREPVERAIKKSDLCNPDIFVTPFAGFSWQDEYVAKLVDILQHAKSRDIL